MSTTTTNFGWTVPSDTDLVKDGAAAIRTAVGGVDTSFVGLKGGTSGQILSKSSGTDLAFTWVDANPGDITGVTAGTGITGGGTSGSVTVSLDQANYGGGQWASGKNKIINGDFAINQRNFTSTTSHGSYGLDRWNMSASDGTTTYSVQQFTTGTAPVSGYEAKQYARMVTTGQTLASANSILIQSIEDVRILAGQTATLSFWAKAASGTPKVAIELAQNFGSGGSPSAEVDTYAGQVTLSTSWTRYSVTVSVPSISGKTVGTGTNSSYLQVEFWLSAGSNFNSRTGSLGIQSNTFEFWGVQLEAGSTATPFQTATGTKQGELAACQRYFEISTNPDVNAVCYTTANAYGTYPFKVTKRVAPSITYPSSLTNAFYAVAVGFKTPTAMATETYDVDALGFIATGFSTTSMAIGYPLRFTGSTQIQVSAEI